MAQAPSNYPPELEKYVKMLKFGVPLGSVHSKMVGDGLKDEFDRYINPETAISYVPSDGNGHEDDDDDDDDDDNTDLRIDDDHKDHELKEDGHETAGGPAEPQAQPQQPAQPAQQAAIRQFNFVPPPNEDLKMDSLQPVPVKKTLLIVNTFIVNTAAFLNKFVSTCETKLHTIRTDIRRMEVTLKILEGKLGSIDWLDSARDGNLHVPTLEEMKHNDFKDDDDKAPPPPEQPEGGGAAAVPDAAASLKSNPEYSRWFTMLRVGVLAQAVRNRMAREDIPEDIIEKIIQASAPA